MKALKDIGKFIPKPTNHRDYHDNAAYFDGKDVIVMTVQERHINE